MKKLKLLGLLLIPALAIASVTVHGTYNGITYVSCTGGCTISYQGWGSYRVTDSFGASTVVSGTVSTSAPPAPGSTPPDV